MIRIIRKKYKRCRKNKIDSGSGSAGDDERPELPDPDSEYLELQLYLKSDDIMESSVIKEYDLDDNTYAEEEGKVYDAADDSEWKAVGEKMRIDIR